MPPVPTPCWSFVDVLIGLALGWASVAVVIAALLWKSGTLWRR